MTANPTRLLTAEHVEAAFVHLMDLGIELPARLAIDAHWTTTVATYARRLGDAGITPEELADAPWGYVRKRIDHGGRRPWPDAGALLAAVQDARVEARPTFGAIRPAIERMMSMHYGAPTKGFDAARAGIPAAVQDIAVEAVMAAGVSRRGDEELRFVLRDVEREYEARRVRL